MGVSGADVGGLLVLHLSVQFHEGTAEVGLGQNTIRIVTPSESKRLQAVGCVRACETCV